jgi:hypothetical protein
MILGAGAPELATGCAAWNEIVPQRLKPNSLQSIYVRPKGRILQENEPIRGPFGWGQPAEVHAKLAAVCCPCLNP